jgi:hypothetical protein
MEDSMDVDLWPAAEDVLAACRFALRDADDGLVVDIIGYADVKWNAAAVARQLKREIDERCYTPEPVSYVGVPETPFAVRPRPVISIRDLIVVHAFFNKLAPFMDSKLSSAVLTHRWEPAPISTSRRRAKGEGVASTFYGHGSTAADGAERFRGGGICAAAGDHYTLLKSSVSRYEFCAKMDVHSLLENMNVNLLHYQILKSSEENGGSLPGFNAALEALFGIYECWARTENGDSNSGNFISAEDRVSKFLANFALVELDRAMDNGADDAAGKYFRFFDDVVFFSNSEDEARRSLSASEKVLRGLGFDARSNKSRVIPAAALLDGEAERWVERLGPEGTGAAAARDFLEGGYFDGDVEKWGRPCFRALEVLREEGDDSFFNQVLQTFLHNPTRELLAHNYAYLRYFSARFFFTSAVVVALSRQSVKIPFHCYYLYRLGAYDRGYSPALKELALYDVADGAKPWYWRAGALFCLNTFDLPARVLDEIETLTAGRCHPAVARAARVVLQQRPAGEESAAPTLVEGPPGRGDGFLAEYFRRATAEEALARALLEEIREIPVDAPDFIDRLHQLDLLKKNAVVKEEFLDVLDGKIAECDLSWARLLSRLEGIRNRRLR